MMQFKVDEDLCIQCGDCSKVCPYLIIELVEGSPVVNPEKEGQCIECQHCFTVCKPGAISIFGFDPADSEYLKGNLPDPAKLETLMAGRRSVRHYKPDAVDPQLLDRIMAGVRTAPTGVNRRSTLFTLVDDPAVMEELRVRSYAGLRKAVEEGTLPKGLEFFEGISDAYESKRVDILYRGAPHFLVTSTPKDNPSGEADSYIAMTYFELLAASHGLGTVWDGLAKWSLLAITPDVGGLLSIPEDHVVGGMMAFGLPAVRYHRTVQRLGGTISRVTI